MASVIEYFEKDFSHVAAIKSNWMLHLLGGTIPVTLRVLLDVDANAKFISYYLPTCEHPYSACLALLNRSDDALKLSNDVEVRVGLKDYFVGSSKNLIFTKKIFIYSENELTEQERSGLANYCTQQGFYFAARGPKYADLRNSIERPLAFISHDSRDKDDVARVLAIELTKLSCPVWYDEFSLKIGDSLRESIEKGLKECKKCIVVLSANFLKNNGWTKKEFDSIFTRELIEEKKLFLPIWHGVTREEVFEYSPALADRVAVNWTLGAEEVARRIFRAIT